MSRLERRKAKAATNNFRLLFVYGKPNVTRASWVSHHCLRNRDHWLRNSGEMQKFWKWQIEAEQQTENPSVFAGYDHIHQLPLYFYSSRKAPSHKMQMVFFFFVVNALLSRLRSMVLIRHCFVQEKWPTLARIGCINERNHLHMCTVLLLTKIVMECMFLWGG